VPRRPRSIVPNGIYHVTSRGNRQQPIFLEGRDYRFFLGLLGIVCSRRGWGCRGYCLMSNHYHVVVETPDADLSAGMQALNGEYAHYFNVVHGTVGHLFQARFHAVLVESDPHLAELSRYLALNPVRAGLARAARDWRWSTYPAIAEDRSSPAFVDVRAILGLFGRDRERARASFVRFVEDGGLTLSAAS
jgi:REP element-mobilizing transposase RayT